MDFEQICLTDIELKEGDELYKDGVLYAKIEGITDNLVFLLKDNNKSGLPDARRKDRLINGILTGTYTLKCLNFK